MLSQSCPSPSLPGGTGWHHDPHGASAAAAVKAGSARGARRDDAAWIGHRRRERPRAAATACRDAPHASVHQRPHAASQPAAHDHPSSTALPTRSGWPRPPGASDGVTGWTLPAGQSQSIRVPDHYNARIWGRTGCTFDAGRARPLPDGRLRRPLPVHRLGPDPATLAELNFDAWRHLDFYDVSMVDGSNLPMYINTVGGKTPDKVSADGCEQGRGCTRPVACPAALQVKAAGSVVGCISPCARFGTDRYCCRGQYAKGCSPGQDLADRLRRIFSAPSPTRTRGPATTPQRLHLHGRLRLPDRVRPHASGGRRPTPLSAPPRPARAGLTPRGRGRPSGRRHLRVDLGPVVEVVVAAAGGGNVSCTLSLRTPVVAGVHRHAPDRPGPRSAGRAGGHLHVDPDQVAGDSPT